ncbi:MAG: serine/threonine-protein kinase [Bdellovibrionota bacterium]
MESDLFTQSRYRVLSRLHVGGMGEVFLAEQQGTLPRRVVIKRLLPHVSRMPGARERFLEEARLLHRLSHERLPRLWEAGEDASGPFLVLDYIEGASLREVLLEGGPLSVKAAAAVLCETLGVLTALHEAKNEAGAPLGFVHRDLAPENLQLDRQGRVFLLDLGISKSSESRLRTETGLLQGRPLYMAPEILAGGKAAPASDLYSIGVIGAELVGALEPLHTGEPPMTALERAKQEGAFRLHWNENIPSSFREAVERALAPTPAARGTSKEMLDRLAPLANPADLSERAEKALEKSRENLLPGTPTPRLTPIPFSGKKRIPLAAAGVLLIAIAASWWAVQNSTKRGADTPPPPITQGKPSPAPSANLTISQPEPGAFTVEIGGKPYGILKDSLRVTIPAGAHTVTLTDEARSLYYRREVLLGPGEEGRIDWKNAPGAIPGKKTESPSP